jgi:hypothetical protein
VTWAWARIWVSIAREKKDIKGKPLKNNAKHENELMQNEALQMGHFTT